MIAPSQSDSQSGSWRLKQAFPNRWKRLDLQARDTKLLQTLLEQKYLTAKQITQHFFNGKSRYAYLRLWKLRRFGYLEKRIGGVSAEELYFPTDHAYQHCRQRGFKVPPPFLKVEPHLIRHDLLVSEVRFLFEALGFGSHWISERLWLMEHPSGSWAPDGLITIGGDPFAIEVECTQKASHRYEEIFARYQNQSDISACLYLAEDSLVESLISKAGAYPFVYFASLCELFEKREKTQFKNAAGHYLLIQENLESNLNGVPS